MKLIADKLSCGRGGRTIIANLSFEVAAGSALVVTGANGAGKTTLIRTIAGFLPIEAGDLHLEGGTPERSIGQDCHYVGHLNAVKATLTVRENAAFFAVYLGDEKPTAGEASASASVDVALDRLGLIYLADIPAAYLSAGQKRRLGLARLLLARRCVWLLDEPTVSLDSDGQHLLAEITNKHMANGGIVVAATHLPLGFTNASELRLGEAL